MSPRIQVISKEGLNIDRVYDDGIKNENISHLKRVEITNNSLDGIKYHHPHSFRVIEKPKSIFIHPILLLLYGGLITEGIHIILPIIVSMLTTK